MVMVRVYVVTDGVYSDMRIEGASTSLVDAAKIVADKACSDNPLIWAFEGGDEVEGDGTLYYMVCDLQGGGIATTREGVVDYVPGKVNVPPIVKVLPVAQWRPLVFVIGSDKGKVAQAFSDTLAAEAIKRGLVIK